MTKQQKRRHRGHTALLVDLFGLRRSAELDASTNDLDAVAQSHAVLLGSLVDGLCDKRQREVLRKLYGLRGVELSQTTIAQRWRMSCAAIGNIRNKAFELLLRDLSLFPVAGDLAGLGYTCAQTDLVFDIAHVAKKKERYLKIVVEEADVDENGYLAACDGCNREHKCATCRALEILDPLSPVLLWPKLSVRTRKCLENEPVATIHDLRGMSKTKLLRIRNFGVLSLAEVESRLAEVYLCLKEY